MNEDLRKIWYEHEKLLIGISALAVGFTAGYLTRKHTY